MRRLPHREPLSSRPLQSRRYPCAIAVVLSVVSLLSRQVGAQGSDAPEDPVLGAPRVLQSQPFVGRFDEFRYENYGAYDYPRQVGITSNLHNLYSILGDPLVYGSESVSWVERRGLGIQRFTTTPPFIGSLDGSELREDGVHGQSGGSFFRLFNRVVVGTDGTDRWQARLIWADEIRTRFTPLTFKMSNLDGLRLDLATENNDLSVIFSGLRQWVKPVPTLLTPPIPRKFYAIPLLMGAHYERRVGFLNFGATFVNAHAYDPLMGSKSQSQKGVNAAVQTAPALIAIRISDDAPRDGRGGAVLHGVRVLINGQERPDLEPFIVRLRKRGDERQSYVAGMLSSGERKPLPPLENDYQVINRRSGNTFDPGGAYAAFDAKLYHRGFEFPFWVDHLFYRDFKLFGADYVTNTGHDETQKDVVVHEEFAHELAEASGDFGFLTLADLPQAFDGEDYGILYLDLEPVAAYIQSVEVELALADDYRVEMSEIPLAGQAPNPPNPNYRDRYRYASYFQTVARAEGSPQNSRVKTVRVRNGTNTGLTLYSANVTGVYRGYEINAEFARSRTHFQYAAGEPLPRVPSEAISIQGLARELLPGQRNTIADDSYYLTVTRDFERFSFGGEYFSMGPLYNTEYRNFMSRDETEPKGRPLAFNNVVPHRFVEDNDDDDRYPDSWYYNWPSDLQGQSDVDGIFPGLDEDSDGIPDTNRNFDVQPDYVEPFLMYESDPQIYDYGLDLNHNDFIDARENDIEPDYPYDPDLSGLHLYSMLRLAPGLGLTLGALDAEQNAGAAPSKSLYGRLDYMRQVPALGRFFGQFALEKVEDGVADNLSIYSDRVLTLAELFELDFVGLHNNIQIAPFLEEPRADPLLFKNSLWWRFFVDARWSTVPGFNMRNKVKYEINSQQEGKLFDGTFQEGDRHTRWTMVHTIDYTWQFLKKWSLFSAYKFRYRKEWTESLGSATAHERHSIPIVRLDYHLTEQTKLQLGMQGLTSLLPYRVSDLARPQRDFEQRDTVLMMTNRSDYFGYIVATRLGFSKRVKEFNEPRSALIGDEDFVSAFISVVIGFEESDY